MLGSNSEELAVGWIPTPNTRQHSCAIHATPLGFRAAAAVRTAAPAAPAAVPAAVPPANNAEPNPQVSRVDGIGGWRLSKEEQVGASAVSHSHLLPGQS